MTLSQLENSHMSLGNESCSSMASFMSALLEEKMPRDSSCEGFTVNVDIIEDNPTIKSPEQSENNIRRCQSLVTMRRRSRYSSRQVSRWSNTFEPNHERSDPNLFLGTSRSSDNYCSGMASRRVASTESLQLPKRMESPRTFREEYLGGTRPKHNSSNNAGWSKEDVLQSNQRSDRLSQLFNMTLTLSPEPPQSKKKTTRATKYYKEADHSEHTATSSGRVEATSDPHTGQTSSSRRLHSPPKNLPGKLQNPLVRSTSMDSAPIIPRRCEIDVDSTNDCHATSLVAKAVQQRLKRDSSSDVIGNFATAGSSASQSLSASLSSFSSTGSNSSGQGSCRNLVRRSPRDSMMRRQRSHGSGMDKRGGMSGRRAGRKASYLQDPSVLGLTISKKTAPPPPTL